MCVSAEQFTFTHLCVSETEVGELTARSNLSPVTRGKRTFIGAFCGTSLPSKTKLNFGALLKGFTEVRKASGGC